MSFPKPKYLLSEEENPMKMVQMNVRCPEWIRVRLNKEAKRRGKSKSQLVREILEHAIENMERYTKPK